MTLTQAPAPPSIRDLLRDPMWQFAGALFAFLALVVAVIAIISQIRRKQLAYEIGANIPLLTLEEEVAGKLQILFDQQVVNDVRLLKIRPVNSGRIPIVPSDYVEPVVVDFGGEARLLSVDVFAKSPPNLHGTFSSAGGRLTFSPMLLNAGDSFAVKLLVAHFGDAPTVDGRIVGVKAIQRLRQGNANFWLAAAGAVVALVGLVLEGHVDRPHRALKPREIWYLGLASVGYIMVVIAIIRRGRFAKRLLRLLQSLAE